MSPIAWLSKQAAQCTDGHMLEKAFFKSATYTWSTLLIHTVSRVDFICMWLTFVALVISSVNGHSSEAALKACS